MTANDTTTLHEKSDARWPTGTLLSMMDLMGQTMSCDNCGRWQRLGSLSETEARKLAETSGWLCQDGRDLCRLCTKKPPDRDG